MKIFKNFIFFSLVSFLVACQSEKSDTMMGYHYTIHNSTGEQRPSIGDYTYFGLVIMDEKDSIIQTMTKEPQMPVIQIPNEEDMAKQRNPVVGVIQKMSIGDSATIIMPIDSFRNTGMNLSQFEEIRYKVKLEKILSAEEYKAEMERQRAEMAAQVEETKKLLPEITQKVEDFLRTVDKGSADLQTTDSGLQYKIINPGDGPQITQGSNVEVHYYGALMDGQPFDNSYKRGNPFRLTVGVGQVIKGWDEGLQILKEGGEAFLVIPSELAYGATGSGSIPPNAPIMFHVNVKTVY